LRRGIGPFSRLGEGVTCFKAAIEDAATGETIKVADPAMAESLAGLLNTVAVGGLLPPAGEQHRPSRFLLTHDPVTPATGGASVVYVYRMSSRIVADAPSDEVAQLVARLLNHTDYPMLERRSPLPYLPWPPTVGRLREPSGELPEPTFKKERKPLQARVVGVALASLIPIVAVLILAGFAVGWPFAVGGVALYGVFIIVMTFALRR
jgi:hypothetical protein